MRVKLYIEVKKSVSGFGMYPLCITKINKYERKILFEGGIRPIMYLKTNKTERLARALANSDMSEPLSDTKENKIILYCYNAVIKEGQIYKDKKILVFYNGKACY